MTLNPNCQTPHADIVLIIVISNYVLDGSLHPLRTVHPVLFVLYFMLCTDLKCVITAFVSEISYGRRALRQLVNGLQVIPTADVNFRQHLTNTSKEVKVAVNEPDHS